MPQAATDIVEAHDLDSGEVCGRFSKVAPEAPALRALPANTPSLSRPTLVVRKSPI